MLASLGVPGHRVGGILTFMTLDQAMAELKALGTDKMRSFNVKHGYVGEQFGLMMGDVRKVAKLAKTDHQLALRLWETGNLDARFLATLTIKPKELSLEELDRMVRSATFANLADWLISYVVKQHPEKEKLREQWMQASDPVASRAGWSLTTERVVKNPEGLDLESLLDRIESELAAAPELAKWTMNFCLGEIGINHAEHRKRAIEIGEKVGAYRDYPHNKGCIPPYVPVWVAEMAKRHG